jgi:ribosomal protein L15E
MEAFTLQRISDHAAYVYMDQHGRLTWRDLERATKRTPVCSKLQSYWTYCDCGYRKQAQTCAEPEILSECPLRHRRGLL